VDDLETRELRYFLTVAEELHFGRAAARLGMSQPPLSRAVRQLEQRIGVDLFVRDPRGVRLTTAGTVLVGEARSALAAVAAAGRRTRRAGLPTRHLVLAVKAGADHDLLQALLDVHGADPDGLPIEVLFGEVHEQAAFLRDGRADVALMHRTYDDLTGFDTEDLRTEDQVAILPRTHPLAARESLVQADLRDLPDLPAARWPRPDGSYPDGPGARGPVAGPARPARRPQPHGHRHPAFQPHPAVAGARRRTGRRRRARHHRRRLARGVDVTGRGPGRAERGAGSGAGQRRSGTDGLTRRAWRPPPPGGRAAGDRPTDVRSRRRCPS